MLSKWDFNTCFPANIAKFLRTPISKNVCERLLLSWEILYRCSLQIKFASNIFYAPHFWLSDIFKGHRNEALAWFELKYCVVTGIIKTDSFQEKLVLYGSSPPKVFLGIGILRKCSKFTGKHPRRSVISVKFQSNSHFGMSILLQIGCIF